jgi:hypothetical protein
MGTTEKDERTPKGEEKVITSMGQQRVVDGLRSSGGPGLKSSDLRRIRVLAPVLAYDRPGRRLRPVGQVRVFPPTSIIDVI